MIRLAGTERHLATVIPPTNNVDAAVLPFQRWYRFKEAFSPSLVEHLLGRLRFQPRTCLDPFGGSGTTAVTAQRLGIQATTIEVNPFLADLIEAKLAMYELGRIRGAWREILHDVAAHPAEPWVGGFPRTFVEPGVNGRWVFDRIVAERIGAYRRAIQNLNDDGLSRLFRVVLAAVLVANSNVTISGKGRRYRAPRVHKRSVAEFDESIDRQYRMVFADISRHGTEARTAFKVIRGDARQLIAEVDPADAIIFSPPYPNSFDYTDIYNVELWGAGYLSSPGDNRSLRESTMRSHVQIVRRFDKLTYQSDALQECLTRLDDVQADLWDRHIPAMVEAYFVDLCAILDHSRSKLSPDGRIWVVIGESRYAGVKVHAAQILDELAGSINLRVLKKEPVRSMRASPQQGGNYVLSETLVEMALA